MKDQVVKKLIIQRSQRICEGVLFSVQRRANYNQIIHNGFISLDHNLPDGHLHKRGGGEQTEIRTWKGIDVVVSVLFIKISQKSISLSLSQHLCKDVCCEISPFLPPNIALNVYVCAADTPPET